MAPHVSFGAPCRSGNMVTLRRRDGLRIPVHKELAPLLALMMDLTEAVGYNIRPDWTWGYSCRFISGTRTRSNHSWGTAVDMNAPANPYASAEWHRRNATSRPFGLPRRTNIPQSIFEMWERQRFRLGVRYESKPDPMHFEYMGSVTQCRQQIAALKGLVAKPPAPKPPPPPPPPEDDVRYIIKGSVKPEWYITDGITKRHVDDQKEAGGLAFAGLAVWNKGKPFVWAQEQVDDITTMPKGKTLT